MKMVKHIILWTLKEEFNNEEVKNGIKTGLEGLKGVIDGLVEIKVQTEKLDSSNADVMLYSEFESVDALKNYAVHPHLLIFLPVVFCAAAAVYFVRKHL